MRPIKVIINILLGILFCNQVYGQEKDNISPKKDSILFFFSYNQLRIEIDSKKGTYTRVYLSGPKSVQIELTEQELEKVLTIYFTEGLNKLPEKYINNCQEYYFSSYDCFIFKLGEKKKTFFYSPTSYECPDSESQVTLNSLKKLKEVLLEILKNNVKVNELEPTDVKSL